MDIEVDGYLRAGEIACRVIKGVAKLIRAGAKVLEVTEAIERAIVDLGGSPAFPVNISVNEVAAHYTPEMEDPSLIPEDALVKVDVGVHVEGYLADTALTIALNDKYELLCAAVRDALEKALSRVERGVRFSDVGEIVSATIRSYGLKPVYNLSGHSLDRYVVHAGDVIPNYRDKFNLGSFRPGKAYAIEPFATTGEGYVVDTEKVAIYALKPNPKRLNRVSAKAQELFNIIYNERRTLPFTSRWYLQLVGRDFPNLIRELLLNDLVRGYPVLVERSRGLVAQYEHTVLILNDGSKVVTTLC